MERPILSMIHRYNIAELSLVDRPVKGPDAGFGSIVNKHNAGHDKPYRKTASSDAFGYENKLSAKGQQENFGYTQTVQGGLS